MIYLIPGKQTTSGPERRPECSVVDPVHQRGEDLGQRHQSKVSCHRAGTLD